MVRIRCGQSGQAVVVETARVRIAVQIVWTCNIELRQWDAQKCWQDIVVFGFNKNFVVKC